MIDPFITASGSSRHTGHPSLGSVPRKSQDRPRGWLAPLPRPRWPWGPTPSWTTA